MAELLSRRRGEKRARDDYLYVYSGLQRAGLEKVWRCEKKNTCNARMYTETATGEFLRVVNEHNHPPNPEKVEAEKMASAVRRMSATPTAFAVGTIPIAKRYPFVFPGHGTAHYGLPYDTRTVQFYCNFLYLCILSVRFSGHACVGSLITVGAVGVFPRKLGSCLELLEVYLPGADSDFYFQLRPRMPFQNIIVKPDTTTDKILMLQAMLRRKEIVMGNLSTTVTLKDKEQAWKEIKAELNAGNAITLASKSWKILRDQYWADMRRRTIAKCVRIQAVRGDLEEELSEVSTLAGHFVIIFDFTPCSTVVCN